PLEHPGSDEPANEPEEQTKADEHLHRLELPSFTLVEGITSGVSSQSELLAVSWATSCFPGALNENDGTGATSRAGGSCTVTDPWAACPRPSPHPASKSVSTIAALISG